MKTLIAFCLCFCVLISYALSYQQDGLLANDLLEGDYDLMDKRDSSELLRRPVRYDKFIRFLQMNNRGKNKSEKKKTCSEWQMACTPSSNKPETTCCSGLVCKCNLWGANCRCDDKIG